jgi:hypothetical protein
MSHHAVKTGSRSAGDFGANLLRPSVCLSFDLGQSDPCFSCSPSAFSLQARKLALDGSVLPWLVGTESCDVGLLGGVTGMRNRGWGLPSDTRMWTLVRTVCGRV